MARKDELRYILAEIERDIALNRKIHVKESSEGKTEHDVFQSNEFQMVRTYPDHDVRIEWKREKAEA